METSRSLRLGFAGTPLFAAEHLRYLLNNSKHEIVGVWTQPDRPAGRGKQTQFSEVKLVALEHNLAVFQPAKLLDADQAQMAALNLDLLIVVAYGLILPQKVLDTPRYGCINVHASLLPRWRGAAPIQRAIEAGDKETGVCIMQMDAGLDTGDVIGRRSFPIRAIDTAGMVHDRLIELGAPLLVDCIDQLAAGDAKPEKQSNADKTYAAKLNKSEAEINWSASASVLDRKIRAFNPVPVAYTPLGPDQVRIWQAYPLHVESLKPPGTIIEAGSDGIDVACGEGALRLKILQLPGKKPTAAIELLRGNADRFAPGKLFNSSSKIDQPL